MNTVDLPVSPEFSLPWPFRTRSVTRNGSILWPWRRGFDIALDLGTANTLMHVRTRGIVLREPSMVAVEEGTERIVAVGRTAREMFGRRGQGYRYIRPLKDGVVSDFPLTAVMIRQFLEKSLGKWRFQKPRVMVGVPAGVTQVEKHGILEVVLDAGAGAVEAVEEPMAAALGAGLPVERPVATMVVDIGGGTTEVAVISLGGTVYSHSLRVAGDEMDLAIVRHVQKAYRLEIGVLEAERIKLLIGSALPFRKERTTLVCGRDLATGMPIQREVTDTEIRIGLSETLNALSSAVLSALESLTPEMASDVAHRGITLTGGGSLLKGLPEFVKASTGVTCLTVADPLSTVVRGIGAVVEDYDRYKVLCIA